MSANNPPPPFRAPVVDDKGYLTDIWTAWFNSFYVAVNAIPTGIMVPFASNVVPAGWLLCDGSVISRNAYKGLFDTIGTRFGAGDGSTTFALPDPTDKFIRSSAAADIGGSGGNESFTLVLANLPNVALEVIDPGHTHIFDPVPHHHLITDPQHNHTFTPSGHSHTVPSGIGGIGTALLATASHTTDTATSLADGNGTVNANATGITIQDTSATGTNEVSETGVTVNLLGESEAVSLLPPYLNIVYIIKT